MEREELLHDDIFVLRAEAFAVSISAPTHPEEECYVRRREEMFRPPRHFNSSHPQVHRDRGERAHLSEWRISLMSCTTGSMSRRISASAALNGSGGSGATTATGGSASLDTGGSAGGGGSPAVGGPARSRRRGAGAAHGAEREARRRMSGAAARGSGRGRAAAMPCRPRGRRDW